MSLERTDFADYIRFSVSEERKLTNAVIAECPGVNWAEFESRFGEPTFAFGRLLTLINKDGKAVESSYEVSIQINLEPSDTLVERAVSEWRKYEVTQKR